MARMGVMAGFKGALAAVVGGLLDRGPKNWRDYMRGSGKKKGRAARYYASRTVLIEGRAYSYWELADRSTYTGAVCRALRKERGVGRPPKKRAA